MDLVELVRQGGTVLVIIFETYALIELWRRYNASQEARISEMKLLTEAAVAQTRLFANLERAVELMDRPEG